MGCNRYKIDQTNVLQRSGRPIEMSTALLENRIETLAQENLHVTVVRLVETCNASIGTVHSIVFGKLKARGHKTVLHTSTKTQGCASVRS